MADLIVFNQETDLRHLAGGRVTVEVGNLGHLTVLRVEHGPGWRWSVHSIEAGGVARCPNLHVGVMVGGRLGVLPAEGEPYEVGVGDLVVIRPGHDAWTVGDQPAVMIQFGEGDRPEPFGYLA